jgi:hypothetical protein
MQLQMASDKYNNLFPLPPLKHFIHFLRIVLCECWYLPGAGAHLPTRHNTSPLVTAVASNTSGQLFIYHTICLLSRRGKLICPLHTKLVILYMSRESRGLAVGITKMCQMWLFGLSVSSNIHYDKLNGMAALTPVREHLAVFTCYEVTLILIE